MKKIMIEDSNWAPFVAAILITTAAMAMMLWLLPLKF